MNAHFFLTLLENSGFDFFTGVPCSYISPLIDLLSKKPFNIHTPAVREDIAVGLAAGAFLARKKPLIYMQNSGLGYSLEAFASLHLIYHFQALVLVTYRGPQDPGMEEHAIMGQHTEEILSTFKLNYSILSQDFSSQKLKHISTVIEQTSLPYFLLIPQGVITS